MGKPRILAFAGSLRRDSFNKKLVKIAALGARNAGAEVTEIDLGDYPLPIYDGDLEGASGLPENAKKLKALFLEHQGLLLSCPEFNSSITALLKNTIDWVSRPAPGEAPLAAFSGKVVSLMAASPGALGGLRGLVHVRSILGNIKCIVLPDQVAVSKAAEAFDDSGKLKDAKQQASIEKLGASLADTVAKLHG
jgi:chromate reductase, NAD(P)H dehydrogenase (quinone)